LGRRLYLGLNFLALMMWELDFSDLSGI